MSYEGNFPSPPTSAGVRDDVEEMEHLEHFSTIEITIHSKKELEYKRNDITAAKRVAKNLKYNKYFKKEYNNEQLTILQTLALCFNGENTTRTEELERESRIERDSLYCPSKR